MASYQPEKEKEPSQVQNLIPTELIGNIRRRRKRSRHREGYKSSYDVFTDFVKITNGGNGENETDVSAVFSQDCFNLWVSSRAKAPKQPHESFRRALTSHAKGVDGRKPFEEEVEREIVKALRERKTWACFKNHSDRIGVNGFRGLGYHEKRRNKQNQETPVNINSKGSNVFVDKKDQIRKTRYPIDYGGDVATKSDSHEICNILDREASEKWADFEAKIKDGLDFALQVKTRGNDDFFFLDLNPNPRKRWKEAEVESVMTRKSKLSGVGCIDDCAENGGNHSQALIVKQKKAETRTYTLSSNVAYWLRQLFTPREINTIAQISGQLGRSWFDPSVFLRLDRSPHEDPRMSHLVFYVPPERQYWRPGIPRGAIRMDRGSKMILDHDENTSLILRSNTLSSQTMYYFIPSATEAVLRVYSIAAKLHRGQTAWTRARLYRGDGSLAYFMFKIQRGRDSRTYIEFQDISDEMSPLLQLRHALE